MNYSTTQASNIATIVGILVFLLSHFNINIGSEELTLVVGAVFTLGGIGYNWYHRYNAGDLKLSGFRK